MSQTFVEDLLYPILGTEIQSASELYTPTFGREDMGIGYINSLGYGEFTNLSLL